MTMHARSPRWRSRRSAQRGQTLVEFALVFPIFLLLLFATVDAGRFIFALSAVSNAAREGARLGSVEASWMGSTDPSCGTAGGPVCPANVATLRAHITAAANRQMAPFGAVTNLYTNCVNSTGTPPTGAWTTTTCASPNSGGTISVRTTYAWSALTPVISGILGTLTASGSASVTIN
jgi:Flp pilus assembly protein TadG